MISYRSVCTAHAGAALLGGFAVLLMPGPMLQLFALEATDTTQLVGRLFGGVLFALGGTLVVAREVTMRRSQVVLMMTNAACDAALAMAIGLFAWQSQGSPLLWGLAALFAVNLGSWLVALALPAPSARLSSL
jgi:hypothetical protein